MKNQKLTKKKIKNQIYLSIKKKMRIKKKKIQIKIIQIIIKLIIRLMKNKILKRNLKKYQLIKKKKTIIIFMNKI